MTKVVHSNHGSNQTAFGSGLLEIAQKKTALDTGPLMLVQRFEPDLLNILAKIESDPNAKHRKLILQYWADTSSEGEAHNMRYAVLVANKSKTQQQKVEQDTLHNQRNAVNSMVMRALDTLKAITFLRTHGRTVNVAPVAGSPDTFACYVVYPTLQEFENVKFAAKHIERIAKVTDKINDAMSTADVLGLVLSNKNGAANNDKGANGTRIAPSKMTEAITNLDTSLAAIVSDKNEIGASPSTKDAFFLFWARLDALMTDAQKTDARVKFNAEAAKEAKEGKRITAKIKTALKGKVAAK